MCSRKESRTARLTARIWQQGRKNRHDQRAIGGEEASARFIDRHGDLQRAAGRVIRNEAGELVIESWSDGGRQETAVTRDANVERTDRFTRHTDR